MSRNFPVSFLAFLGFGAVGAALASVLAPVWAASPAPVPVSAPLTAAMGEVCATTWNVFATNATLIRTITESQRCFGSGEAGSESVDLDGDGKDECLLASEYGEMGGGGSLGTSAVRAMKRNATGITESVVGAIGRPESSYAFIPGGATDFYAAVVGCWDASGDGLPDLVVSVRWVEASGSKKALAYFRNLLPPPNVGLAADINRDGVVNGADLTLLLVAWAAGS